MKSEVNEITTNHGGSRAGGAREGRVRPRLFPPYRKDRPVEGERPPRLLPAEHVLPHRGGGAGLPAEADELPVPHPDLQVADALLPRSADPIRRARNGVPVRTVRHAARAAAWLGTFTLRG